MQQFIIQDFLEIDDGIGGFVEEWSDWQTVYGYLDLITGTDINQVQNAFVEDSSHILIIPKYTPDITDSMRVIDKEKRWYSVTYVDNPVGMDHHNEIYLRFGGVMHE